VSFLSRWSMALLTCMALMCQVSSSRAQESPHGKLTIPCENCHVTTSWKQLASPMKFNHDDSRFTLRGVHVSVACKKCHTDLHFTGASSQCADCHQDIHRGELGAACDRCHSPATWLIPDMAQRHNRTKFPLLGAHMTLPCEACHVNQQMNEYVGLPTDCYPCHRTQYDATTAPPHAASGLSTDCAQCHDATAVRWGGGFNHSLTSFPLTGSHLTAPCASCHINGVFAGTARRCVGCHQQQFNATTNPNHVTFGISTECQTCHGTSAWRPATFDHAKTQFPLTGAHMAVACDQCHVNGQYQNLPTQCSGCHQNDYNAVENPKHTLPSFSMDCTVCHATTAWKPSTFNHGNTHFPLTGAHVTTSCALCHLNSVYAGTPTSCLGCHQQDYSNTTNPNHTAASFPTDCQTCHSTTAWSPSTWNHDSFFPISAGSHHSPGRWTTCADCHTVPTNYKAFSCVTCHDHSQSIMDPRHSGVSGYIFDSAACYRCHPRGGGG
jgi:hypothetical protein